MTLIPNKEIFGYLQPISLWVTIDNFWFNKRMDFDRLTKCCILNQLLNKIQSIMDPKIIRFVWTRFLEKHEEKVWVNAFVQSSKYKVGIKCVKHGMFLMATWWKYVAWLMQHAAWVAQVFITSSWWYLKFKNSISLSFALFEVFKVR